MRDSYRIRSVGGKDLSGGAVAWYEWPFLLYFMLHFFPPLPAALPNVCLWLALLGVLQRYASQPARAMGRLNHPLLWLWLLLAGLLGLSILQVPDAMRAESWHRFVSDLGKGSLFGVVAALHLDDEGKAKRLLSAAVLGVCGMLLHYVATTVMIVHTTGNLPVQRDYLYWLLLYFPMIIGLYFIAPRWRLAAVVAAVGTIALAVATGFRGAMLSLLVMSLAFAFMPGFWRLLVVGAGVAACGVIWMLVRFPEQGGYVLSKLQQTDSSGRVASHWLPAWQLSLDHPWLGNGFGHQVFGRYVSQGLSAHPSWLPQGMSADWIPSSPHSVVFEVLFAAGFPGLLALAAVGGAVLICLGLPLWRSRAAVGNSLSMIFAHSVFISLIGCYAVFAQFEAPAWRSFPVLIGLAVAAAHFISAWQVEQQKS